MAAGRPRPTGGGGESEGGGTPDAQERRRANTQLDEALARVTAEANGIFAKMGAAVEEAAAGRAATINVVEIARRAGLEINEQTLDELQIDRTIHALPWLPWHHWWPWRPLWCWWWRRYYPWYRCCPWWWHRCHWWQAH